MTFITTCKGSAMPIPYYSWDGYFCSGKSEYRKFDFLSYFDLWHFEILGQIQLLMTKNLFIYGFFLRKVAKSPILWFFINENNLFP